MESRRIALFRREERREDRVAELNRTEEFFEFAIVNANATLTGANTNARDRSLTTTGAQFVVLAVAFNDVIATFNHMFFPYSMQRLICLVTS